MEPSRSGHLASRRGILGALASGSVLAALGLRPAPQTVAAGPMCVLDTTITVRLGASAGQLISPGAPQPGQLRGRLQFEVLPSGALQNASFQLGDGTVLPAVGQADGHGLQVRITLSDGRSLTLVGVGEEDMSACRGAVDGLAGGPMPGDLGDWQAVGYGFAADASAGSGNPAGANDGAGVTTAPTMTPAPLPEPEAPGCQAGLIWCWDRCVDVSRDPTHCGDCDHACVRSATCIEGVCTLAWECLEGTVYCDGNCVNLGDDPTNCGACGYWCPDNEGCFEGVCSPVRPPQQCKPDGEPCASPDECCSNYCSNGGAVCAVPECAGAGEPCAVNWDCCSGVCNSYDYSYTCT